MVTVNATTPFNDLPGGKFIRHRTMAQFLDAANFPNNSNPFGTPSSSTELPQEIYYINQKTLENREQIIFELVSALDLQNVRVPIRQVLDNDFTGVGRFVGRHGTLKLKNALWIVYLLKLWSGLHAEAE